MNSQLSNLDIAFQSLCINAGPCVPDYDTVVNMARLIAAKLLATGQLAPFSEPSAGQDELLRSVLNNVQGGAEWNALNVALQSNTDNTGINAAVQEGYFRAFVAKACALEIEERFNGFRLSDYINF
ncbi:hypothetical protein FA15DRAFT_659609 [Coprinopsis marcescibilis]|uniref:Uncharacterized protein n=1 Tax=Coprinopsis marcescibilis TaxID=230819 RepID=A0A5C3KI46_COPMA|nr:hypothetical protein FA15DRAFT_659609 [Coprinopsis marcescibilis]